MTAVSYTHLAVGEKIAVIKTDKGDIKVRLFPEEAPRAVENFVTHDENGYYDGLIFHRVIKDFMIPVSYTHLDVYKRQVSTTHPAKL